MASRPSPRPTIDATIASSSASTVSCRVTAARLAPSAARRAISRSRSTALASSNWLTLTHAISSTTPTAANKSISAGREVPTTASCAGSTTSDRPDAAMNDDPGPAGWLPSAASRF